jgi:phage terminase Nu1 subunit (DNA packaging protein)
MSFCGEMAKPANQRKFARRVGVSQPDISKLVTRGVLTRGATEKVWLLEYTANLREVAAQHKSEEGIDRVREAALLDRRKREELEIKLAQLRRELWPTSAIAVVLHQHNTNEKNRWLSLPATFKAICPHISPRDIDRLDGLVRENLTDQAHDQLPPDIRQLVQRYFDELHAAAEVNGEPVGGSVSPAQPGKQRSARPLAHGAHPLPAKNHGRSQ